MIWFDLEELDVRLVRVTDEPISSFRHLSGGEKISKAKERERESLPVQKSNL